MKITFAFLILSWPMIVHAEDLTCKKSDSESSIYKIEFTGVGTKTPQATLTFLKDNEKFFHGICLRVEEENEAVLHCPISTFSGNFEVRLYTRGDSDFEAQVEKKDKSHDTQTLRCDSESR